MKTGNEKAVEFYLRTLLVYCHLHVTFPSEKIKKVSGTAGWIDIDRYINTYVGGWIDG